MEGEMEGEAEKAGISDEGEVAELCKDVRKELYAKRYARND
jgi:hypothetical protein